MGPQATVFTEEQLRQEARASLATALLWIKGMIYTATTATSTGQIKRFNLGGTNTLPAKDYGNHMPVQMCLSSAIADDHDFITAVDANRAHFPVWAIG